MFVSICHKVFIILAPLITVRSSFKNFYEFVLFISLKVNTFNDYSRLCYKDIFCLVTQLKISLHTFSLQTVSSLLRIEQLYVTKSKMYILLCIHRMCKGCIYKSVSFRRLFYNCKFRSDATRYKRKAEVQQSSQEQYFL